MNRQPDTKPCSGCPTDNPHAGDYWDKHGVTILVWLTIIAIWVIGYYGN